MSRAELNQIGLTEAKKMLQQVHNNNKQRSIEIRLGKAGIPKRFVNKKFTSFIPGSEQQNKYLKIMQAYANRFKKITDNGTCLILTGKSGTGKTHLAVAVLNEISKNSYSVVFTSVAEILRRLRSTYGKSDETEADVYELYTKPDLIVIDEVGVAIGDAEKRKAMLFDLINTRYNAVKPTILIGNLTTSEMESYLGTRIFDRLLENNGIIMPFEWNSYRRNNHAS